MLTATWTRQSPRSRSKGFGDLSSGRQSVLARAPAHFASHLSTRPSGVVSRRPLPARNKSCRHCTGKRPRPIRAGLRAYRNSSHTMSSKAGRKRARARIHHTWDGCLSLRSRLQYPRCLRSRSPLPPRQRQRHPVAVPVAARRSNSLALRLRQGAAEGHAEWLNSHLVHTPSWGQGP
jgi:hypothetical protein